MITRKLGLGDRSNQFDIIVRVEDESGAFDEQSFTINVTEIINNPPQITSSPITCTLRDQLYVYDLEATDPDDDPLMFSLIESPMAMTIDSNTGLIEWNLASLPEGTNLDDGLVGYYPFKGNADDASGNSNHGTVYGATLAYDRCGNLSSYLFDGDFDYILVPNDDAWDLGNGPFSICALVRIDDLSSNNCFVSHWGDVSSYGWIFYWNYLSDGKLRFEYSTDGAYSMIYNITVDWEPNGNVWYHVMVTRDNDNTVHFYVDGQEITNNYNVSTLGSTSGEPNAIFHPNVPLRIGFYDTINGITQDSDFSGSIDEVRIYKRTLTDLEIQYAYGKHNVTARVDDSYGGYDQQSFLLSVADTGTGPRIISVPMEAGTCDAVYVYDVEASSDGCTDFVYTLTVGPEGMIINSVTGMIEWTPASSQIGVNEVEVMVTDCEGMYDTQRYTVVVSCVQNNPPIVGGIPDVTMLGGNIQDVIFERYDPDGDEITISVQGLPIFGIIDEAYTVPNWTQLTFTPSADVDGDYPMTVVVSDGQLSATEDFVLTVTRRNQSPSIVSTPTATVLVSEVYTYDVEATDADGDTLTYSLTTYPPGMSINAVTGLITWTPALGQVGDHAVVVQVDDGNGGSAMQEFSITVSESGNHDPLITSTPPTTVPPLFDYSYQVIAEDLDDDNLTYDLIMAPSGMTISTEGLIYWPASPDRPDTADVDLLVSDGRGGEATQSWTITVQEVAPPQVTLLMSTNMPNVGETITVQVEASSDVGIKTRSLIIGSDEVILDAEGIGQYTTHSVGFFEAVATAIDIIGQTDDDKRPLLVGDPYDVTPPVVSLHEEIGCSETACLEITDLYTVVGTATDENGVYYELRMREQGTTEWMTFANGYGNKVNEELGIFDPTVIRNGVHEIHLYAYDPSGNISTDMASVIVDGGLKVGQVNFAQEDMSLPGMGFPICVIREYDSRTQGPGDFGPGWNLASSNVTATTTGILGEEWGQYINNMNVCLIYPNKQVVIRLSDTEIFKFKIDAVITGTNNKCQYLVDIQYLTIRYIPLDGTLGALEALDFGNEVILQADTITDYDGISIYNPKRFKLTTREGTVYVINSETGIESITDQYDHTISYDDAGIHHSSGASITFERGEGNRIERIKDPQGRTVEYHYDEEGYLEKIVQIGGMTGLERVMAQYSYAGEGKSMFGDTLKRDLRTITAPDGTELGQFEYDTRGRMTGLIDANGNRVIYGYDVPNHRQTITDRLGNVTTYTYDNKGNVTGKTDPLGNLTQWEYDENGNMIRETLPNGAVTVKTYNAAGDVLIETDALGNTTSYTYDAAGRMLTKTDALGRVYTTERDANGNPIREYGPLGDTIWSTYDAEGNLITQKGMNGAVSAFAYNENGLVTNTETYMENDPNNILSRQETEYDSEGRPVRSVQYVNVGEPDEGMIVTKNEYDDWGNLIRDINPSGTSEFRYDGNGQKIASANHLGQWTHYVYNDQGRLIKTILPDEIEDNDGDPAYPSFDPYALEDNPFTASTYDAEGRILTSIDMFGNVTIYEYDANDNRIRTIHPDGTQSMQIYDAVGNVNAMVDRLGNITSYEYDLIGRQTVRTDGLGYLWTTQYDAAGNRIASIDPVGRITEYVYDEADRLIQTIYPDGSQTSRIYDIHGNITSEIDQAGRITWMSYDQLNRLIEVRQLPEANTNGMAVTNYEYDKQGRKVAQTDALGRRTTWTYDIYGRVIARVLPDGQAETFTYLPDGRKESHTDFNGQVTTYDYDNKGRLIGTHWIDGVNDNIPDISYQYDSTGRIIEAAKGSVTVQYIYDNIRKSLASLIYPGIGRIDYEYDPLGRRIGLTTITGTAANTRVRRIDYSFDPLSRIQSVTSAHGTTLYRYDEVGNMTQLITTDGIDQLVTTYGYDLLNRIISIYAMNTTGNTIASYNYTLDPSGMVMHVMEHGGRTVSYTYDNLARLLTETVSETTQPQKTWTFAYDKVGNRTSQARPDGEVITYTYDDNDRLLTEASNVNGLTTFSYNHNGDLTGMDAPTETATYSYDPVGRLIAAQVNRGGNLLNTMYEYDHNNNRVRSIVTDSNGTQDISMLVDPTFQFAQVLEEQDELGNLVAAYTYGNDLLAQQRPEGLSYYHHDRIGSVRMLTTISGSPVNQYTYEAYGSTLAETATINNHYKYTGEQLIPELGWYYLRARNYSPSIGRFTSVDPFAGVLEEPLSLNKYVYVSNSPINSVDYSGLYGEDIHFYLTYAMASFLEIPKDKASAIAWADQYIDEHEDTQPIRLEITKENVEILQKFHFPHAPGKTVQEDDPEVRKKLISIIVAGNEVASGMYMHIYQDSYSHAGFRSTLGHGYVGTLPDKTYKYIQKTQKMSKRVFDILKMHPDANPKKTYTDFVKSNGHNLNGNFPSCSSTWFGEFETEIKNIPNWYGFEASGFTLRIKNRGYSSRVEDTFQLIMGFTYLL